MALSVNNLNGFGFMGNPIPIEMAETSPNFRKYQFKLMVGSVETIWYEAYRTGADPTVQDVAKILAKFFRQVDYFVPDFFDDEVLLIINDTRICKTYQITVHSLFSDNTPENIVSIQNYAVWGRLPFADYPSNDFFTPGTHQEAVFLNASPNPKKTRKDSIEVLYALRINDDLQASEGKLMFRRYAANGSIIGGGASGIDFGQDDFEMAKVWAFRVDYMTLAFDGLNVPVKWEVWIELKNNSDEYVRASEIRTYFLDESYSPQVRHYVFRNQVGGMDSIYLKGRAEAKLSIERVEAQKFLASDYQLPQTAEYIDFTTTAQTYLIHTGYIETYAEYQLLEEMFKSVAIYEVDAENERLLPVKIVNKNLKSWRDDRTELYAEKLEIAYLFND
jgi:hypothetical protein